MNAPFPITNVRELAQAFHVYLQPPAADLAILAAVGRQLYKDTAHGLGLAPIDAQGHILRNPDPDATFAGVVMTGIVEGTDIEGTSDPLLFPFAMTTFHRYCARLQDYLDEAKAEWDAQGDEA